MAVKSKKELEVKDVEPIRCKEDIEKMKWALDRFCTQRDLMLFNLGINTGMRAGDMLKLKVKDVKRKRRFVVKEGKTDKTRTVHINGLYEELNKYIDTLDSEWLFPSREGNKPISTVQAWRQLNKASEMAEVDSIGTHTMRKTFGYWYYKKEMDIEKLQQILNHSDVKVTKKYIGITQEEIEDTLVDFHL